MQEQRIGDSGLDGSHSNATSVPAARRPTTRRMGPAHSATWHAILDGAETILKDEGYASLNAKRIAERTGIKRQLVYYYFCDIDDLLVQLFRRITERSLAQLRAALESNTPLSLAWEACVDTFDQALILEFLALANRNVRVRDALLEYAALARGLQIGAISKALSLHPVTGIKIAPAALALISTWIGIGLQREGVLGLNQGHAEVREAIGAFLSIIEAQPSADA